MFCIPFLKKKDRLSGMPPELPCQGKAINRERTADRCLVFAQGYRDTPKS